jgi:chromosomal replication initiation ATPase DnaA
MDQHAFLDMPDRRGPARAFRDHTASREAGAEARVFEAVEGAFAVSRDDLRAATRGRCDIALARQAGMYLARVALGMTLARAGHLFGRDRTTASHACRVVEDLRDDPSFDALLQRMECFVLRPKTCNRKARR